MKRLSALIPASLLALALTVPAHADVVWSPVDIAADLFLEALPVLLVVVAVVITLLLIRKFRKK